MGYSLAGTVLRNLPFHLHALELLVLLVVGLAHHRAVEERLARRAMTTALVVLAVMISWPVGDLAARVSLSVAATQRLVVVLGVGPLLWRSVPLTQLTRWTTPHIVDWLATKMVHPAVAMATTTVLGAVTLSPPLVAWGSRDALGRVALLLLTLLAAVTLWGPVLGRVPGAKHLSSVGMGAYLFASALVVTSASFVWIFAVHPLYPTLHHVHQLLGLTPLEDQQVAGVIAKLGAFFVLWAVAFRVFFRDADTEREGHTPLYVADVERLALRAARRQARRNPRLR